MGSGVLIEFRGGFFLLTAAHVIDELKNADLLVPHKNNEIRSIEGSYAYMQSSEQRNQDFLDYTYFRLNDQFAAGLKDHFYFVKENEPGVKKVYAEKELFSFAGCLHRKSNVSGGRAKTDYYAYGIDHAELFEYEYLGFKKDANIVTKFNRKSSFNPKVEKVELCLSCRMA